MNIKEIDGRVWDMNTVEKANIIHYLIGYANSNPEFKKIFEMIMSERLE